MPPKNRRPSSDNLPALSSRVRGCDSGTRRGLINTARRLLAVLSLTDSAGKQDAAQMALAETISAVGSGDPATIETHSKTSRFKIGRTLAKAKA